VPKLQQQLQTCLLGYQVVLCAWTAGQLCAVCMQGRKHAELDRGDVRTLLQHQLEVRTAVRPIHAMLHHAQQQCMSNAVLRVYQEAAMLWAIRTGAVHMMART
jgi:hypothetical protein